jgi:hypothetical protein
VSRDLRKYARSTNLRLGLGAFGLLFIVGLGLIYLFYGKAAAVMGFTCLLAGMVPVVLILLIFYFIDRIMKHAGRE